jgi:hypothetical protein
VTTIPDAPLPDTAPLTVIEADRWLKLLFAGIETVMAAAPEFVTVAPAFTVSGELLVLIVIPLLSTPEQVTDVLACVGSGEHCAQTCAGIAKVKAVKLICALKTPLCASGENSAPESLITPFLQCS